MQSSFLGGAPTCNVSLPVCDGVPVLFFRHQ